MKICINQANATIQFEIPFYHHEMDGVPFGKEFANAVEDFITIALKTPLIGQDEGQLRIKLVGLTRSIPTRFWHAAGHLCHRVGDGRVGLAAERGSH